MEDLYRLLGQETDCEELSRALYFAARSVGCPVVGGMHITCADESETSETDDEMLSTARLEMKALI